MSWFEAPAVAQGGLPMALGGRRWKILTFEAMVSREEPRAKGVYVVAEETQKGSDRAKARVARQGMLSGRGVWFVAVRNGAGSDGGVICE